MYADARLKETATPCATVIASYCSSDYDTASLLSRSPDSSPAGASDNGIETGSDVSSSCGDAAYQTRFTVVPAATVTPSQLVRLRQPSLTLSVS